MNTKIRLLQLGKKQVDLLDELHKQGFTRVDPAGLSNAINHRTNTPLAYRIREETEKILEMWEKEQEQEVQ